MGCAASNDHVEAVMKDDLLQWTVIANGSRVPPRDPLAVVPASRSDLDLMSACGDSPVELSLNPLRATGSCEQQETTPDNSMLTFARNEGSRSASAYLNRTALKAVMNRSHEVSQRTGSIEHWLASVSVTGDAQDDGSPRNSAAAFAASAAPASTVHYEDLPAFPQSPAAFE